MESVLDNITTEDVDDVCGFFEGYTTQRFLIITGASLISVFGVAANMLLVLIFLRNLPSSAYLALLSLMDVFICLTYLLLFGVDAGFVYLKDKTLFALYHAYIVPVFFIAKTTQFVMPFLLILITFERYLWTTRENIRKKFAKVFTDSGRLITIFFLMLVSTVLRVPMLFATEVKQFPLCQDYFRSQSVSPSEWATSSYAFYIFDFQVITAVQTCFPFFVLLLLNGIIIKRLLAQKDDHKSQMYSNLKPRLSNFALGKAAVNGQMLQENYVLLEVATEVMKQSLIQRASRDKREQLRNAIYTMLAIVMSYLVCNGVHLFLTFLERTDSSLLYDSDDANQSSNFYIALSDTVSICYMVSSAVRLFIYFKCNPKLRGEIIAFLNGSLKGQSTSK